MRLLLSAMLILISSWIFAQDNTNQNKFRQLGQELPTPNVYRTASGAPGHQYWQQEADYKMKIRIDDKTQKLYGEQVITYHNNSPDQLRYLWMQLDQNVRSKDSDAHDIRETGLSDKMSKGQIDWLNPDFDGGFCAYVGT